MAFNLVRPSTGVAYTTIHTDVLLKFLNVVSPVVPQRSVSGILKTISITSVDGKGNLTATDCDISVSMDFIGNGNKSFSIAVDYATLHRIMLTAPKGLLLLEYADNNLTLRINSVVCGVVPVIDRADFPHLQVQRRSNQNMYAVSISDIAYVHNYLSPICLGDKEYAGIAGILAECDGMSVGFTATDRKLLVTTGLQIDPVNRCVIPCTTFKVLNAIGGDCNFEMDDMSYMFVTNNYKVTGKCVAGAYPGIHNLEPLKFDHTHTVDVAVLRAELAELMGKIQVNKKGICSVMLDYSAGILHAVPVPTDYKFDESGIKMDAVRLVKLLSRFADTSQVTFKSTCVVERATKWEDSKGVSFLCCLK